MFIQVTKIGNNKGNEKSFLITFLLTHLSCDFSRTFLCFSIFTFSNFFLVMKLPFLDDLWIELEFVCGGTERRGKIL